MAIRHLATQPRMRQVFFFNEIKCDRSELFFFSNLCIDLFSDRIIHKRTKFWNESRSI